MKNVVQASLAAFVMLTLAVVYVAAQQPAVTATQTVSGYVLGPDDEIMIRGIEAPEISGKPDKPVLIGTNGNITLPMIGRIKAAGARGKFLQATPSGGPSPSSTPAAWCQCLQQSVSPRS